MTAELDLVVLVPGKDDEAALKTLIDRRHASLGIRIISHSFLVCPGRDPGCFKDAPALLAEFVNRTRHALVLFDYEGWVHRPGLRPAVRQVEKLVRGRAGIGRCSGSLALTHNLRLQSTTSTL